MTDYAGALKILRKVAEDEHNWRSGMKQIEGLLHAAEEAEQVLGRVEQQKAQLTADIERVQQDKSALEQSVRTVRRELDGFQATLTAREREKAERLGALDAEIRAKEEALAKVTDAFEQFKAVHKL